MTTLFNRMAAEIERVLARQQEFALNASHELRNPLNALLLRVEHLMTGLGPDWKDDVEETREEGRRMTRILETLLGLARGSRTDAEARPVDLVEIARRRADAWRDVGARRALSIVDVGETGPVMATAGTVRPCPAGVAPPRRRRRVSGGRCGGSGLPGKRGGGNKRLGRRAARTDRD